ncbi:MAG: HEAT repeat domain-containing protein [Anaerolineae bacterium]
MSPDSSMHLNVIASSQVSSQGESGARARWQEAASLAGRLELDAVHALLAALGDTHPFVRWQAGVALAETVGCLRRRARLGFPSWQGKTPELTFSGLVGLLCRNLRHADPEVRAATVDVLALLEYEPAAPALMDALADAEPVVRVSAAVALGKLPGKPVLNALQTALADDSLWVRRASADSLGLIADSHAAGALIRALDDPQAIVRASIVNALGRFQGAKVRHALEGCLTDDDATVRWHAARALGREDEADSIAAQGLPDTPAGGSLRRKAMRAVSVCLTQANRLWARVRRAWGRFRLPRHEDS